MTDPRANPAGSPGYREALSAWLQTSAPLFWSDQFNAWIATRYIDCRRVLTDHETFAKDLRRIGRTLPVGRESIQFRDPPNQQPLRQALISSLTPARVGLVVRNGMQTLRNQLSAQPPGVRFDLVRRVSIPVALQVTEDLIGMEDLDSHLIHAIFESLTRGMEASLLSQVDEDALDAADMLEMLMLDWLGRRSSGGMIGELRRTLPAEVLKSTYLSYSLCAVFSACYSTVFALTSSCCHCVVNDRGDLQSQLRQSRDLGVAADEIVRFLSIAQLTSRHATVATQISDVGISRGDKVITLLCAGNHDPYQFDRPNEIILDRAPNQHLGFGWGAHSCVGSRVAKQWLKELLGALSQDLIHVEFVESPQYLETVTLRNMKRLSAVVL